MLRQSPHYRRQSGSGGVSPKHIEQAIIAAGGLDQAIALASHEEARPLLQALLALRSVREERACPALKASRLRVSAAALDRRAERLFAEAAEFFGKAAYRQGKGEAALADEFHCRAKGAEACAQTLAASAVDQRLEAAAVDGALGRAAALAGVIAA